MGIFEIVLLTIPLVLAAILVVGVVGRRKTQSKRGEAPLTVPMPSTEPTPSGGQLTIQSASPQALQHPMTVPLDPKFEPPAAEVDAGALAAAIAKSEAGGDKAELASLYIQQAVGYIAAGRNDDGASRLRDAIRIASLNGLVAPHALARVELGDLYFSNGDPITACEQWQIARNLFHDLARPADRDAVDKRMLSNGCPSDWVLTDF